MTIDFTSSSWCDLPWTYWMPFTNPSTFKKLPSCQGIYRVRAIGGQELFYIGETGRNLRNRLNDLRCNTMKETMPYNDPHTAAPSLWAWRHAESIDFECSATPVSLAVDREEARKLREGLECYLLWQYRSEFGASTRCNHGRFHPRYIKSKDRKNGFQGYSLPDNTAPNEAGGKSWPPLLPLASPINNTWMGLLWSPFDILVRTNTNTIPTSPGVYKIFDFETETLLYIGESQNLRSRLKAHAVKSWECSRPLFSYVQLLDKTPAYQRHEIENDLLGCYYNLTKHAPKFQFINHQSK